MPCDHFVVVASRVTIEARIEGSDEATGRYRYNTRVFIGSGAD